MFRLVTDRDTGRQKGFGFCEYFDMETAQSAIRNLGGHEVNGRHLRVDSTDSSTKAAEARRKHHNASLLTILAFMRM